MSSELPPNTSLMKHSKLTLARMLHGECFDHKTTKIENAALVARNKELTQRRNELQEANNGYLERARKAEAWAQRQDIEIEHWQSNSIETWEAMQAMRNDINEVVPLPSLESDLLQGPENSVFCATVAKAVVTDVGFWIDEAKKWAGMFANKRIEAEMWQHEAHRLQRRGRMWVLIWGLTVLIGWLAFLWVRA